MDDPGERGEIDEQESQLPLLMGHRGDQLAFGQIDRHRTPGRLGPLRRRSSSASSTELAARASPRRGTSASGFTKKETSYERLALPTSPGLFPIGNCRKS